MKLEVLQENLNHGLTQTTRVLANKPQVAILSHVLLKTGDGKLIIITSNQETTIVTQIGAKIIAPGQFTVPGRTFFEIISSLSAEKVTLELNGQSLSVKTGNFSAKINGTPATEYPNRLPEKTSQVAPWTIGSKELMDVITKTVFCTSSDESRAALTGVLLQPTADDDLTLAAADGFRLSVLKIKTKLKDKFIVPAKALNEVAKVLSEVKQEEEINIFFLDQSHQILFDFGEIKIYSHLISGNFPEFEKIIPSNFDIRITTEAREFSKTIRLASIFARESANIIKLKIKNQKLVVSANAPEVGENESEMDVKTEGTNGEFSIAFNYRYLQEFLAAIGGNGEIIMEFSGPTAPGTFRFAPDLDFLHIIMPVRVQE
ncbi:MAG: DNA polymerase III subunit beta [Patescibacteria group bacterium]|nr:DNA polymerase III subunit beta [Patescibacteria group bacterium]MCL5431650.1 DNA polymerase III subunit beta [Patescibacteria group bacterium]